MSPRQLCGHRQGRCPLWASDVCLLGKAMPTSPVWALTVRGALREAFCTRPSEHSSPPTPPPPPKKKLNLLSQLGAASNKSIYPEYDSALPAQAGTKESPRSCTCFFYREAQSQEPRGVVRLVSTESSHRGPGTPNHQTPSSLSSSREGG